MQTTPDGSPDDTRADNPPLATDPNAHTVTAGGGRADAQLAPGMRVGRYHILGLIGRGGMGEVYAAYHPDLDRRIALKIVYGERAGDAERQSRLLREARIIASLNHPNIVGVYDAGIVAGQVYVAMEFVDGATVDAWLREARRSWVEVLEIFTAAARGLAAAHEANVVHRDFKPQNVMIGRDGRVRVMDFGLARPVREGLDSTSARPDNDRSPGWTTSTTAGSMVGTPAYMAPEQLRSGAIDLRADQFSFCVALHEAIYGARPGAGLAPWRGGPAGRAPAWLKKIIRKGLNVDPDERFASMQELLRAIDRRRKSWRRSMLGVGLTVLLAVAAGVGARVSSSRRFACTPPRGRMEAVWSSSESPGSRRAALHRQFLTSGFPGAAETWKRLDVVVGDRLRRWAAMYQDACEATHVRGEQSAEVLDLRMTCLSDDLDATRAYVDRLSRFDPSGLERALISAAALPPVARCADLRDLRAQMPLPTDPVAREQVARLQQAINDAEALRSLTYVKRAAQELTALLPEIRALAYKPLLAQALQKMAAAQVGLEQYAEARQSAREAMQVAEASRDDLTVAQVADELAWIETMTGRFDDAQQALEFGEAAVERAGAQGALIQGWLLNDRGNLSYERGQFEEAERDHRAAITIKTSVLGPRHPDVSGSMSNLALDLAELGRWSEADAMARRAVEMDDQIGSQPSRESAINLTVKAEMLVHGGQLEEAQAALSRAVAIEEEQGDANLAMNATLTDLGELFLLRGRPEDALAALRRAQALRARVGDHDAIRQAKTDWQLGRAMIETKTDVAAGEQLVANACGALARGGYARSERDILRWSRRLPPRDRRRVTSGCSGPFTSRGPAGG